MKSTRLHPQQDRRPPIEAIALALGAPSRPATGRLPLGNRRRALDELFFILLTTMTQYGAIDTFRAVKAEFTPWRRLLDDAAEERLRELISPLGLSRQKAARMVAIAKFLQRDLGTVSLEPLRRMDDADAERFLRTLPGVGVKVARCVLMYSLGRATCPVDTHVYRVARRTGLIAAGVSYQEAHAAVQEAVPRALRYGIHVAFVRLGRELCRARAPKCLQCPLGMGDLCPRATLTSSHQRRDPAARRLTARAPSSRKA